MKKITKSIVAILSAATLCNPITSLAATNANNAVKPTAEFLAERIATIETVTETIILTEETDTNKLLHKSNGYQDKVSFKDSRIDSKYLALASPTGTEIGGSVEVFSTAKEATARNDYLALLDSMPGAFNPGYHEVLGTCVIRASRALTASQQTDLIAALKNAILSTDVPGQVQNPTTVFNGVDYAAEYDAQVYYDNNPDLQAAFGTDGALLIKHYAEYGKAEGRKAK